MSLEIKRKEVTRNLENGMMSYAKEYLPHGFKTYFSTIGLCGMHECCLNFLNKGINSPEGLKFAKKVLLFMRDICEEYKAETGNLYNLEATPAESTSYRFARLDRKWYPNVILSGTEDAPYITNSTHLPVSATFDIIDAIEHQDELQPLYTGGTIFHSFLGEEIDPEICKNIVRIIAEKTRLPYFSITPTFSICTEHKYIKGKHFECPVCGKPTEVYSRIVGYFRPISKWNDGKTQEFKERTVFEVDKSSLPVVQGLTSKENNNNEAISELVAEIPRSTAASAKQNNDTYITLFISTTCSKCSPFKALISSRINPSIIKTINTATEEGIRLAEVFNITKVPTAVILDNGKELCRFSSAKGLNKFLPDLKRLFGDNEIN
jgi:ribonucleoside-triphosphate reductase